MYNKKLIEKIIPTLNFKFPYSVDDYSENLYFENYHKHTCESNLGLSDSAERYSNYIAKTKELNGKCLFGTEHGWQGDWIATYDLVSQTELKYRHAAEAYWVKDRHEADRTNCHMIIVAKTNHGRRRLNYILSMANIDGFYGKPRIDIPLLLEENPDDFIITSACVAGWNYPDADEIWLKVADHFKNNFYLEVQNHNTDKQKILNQRIINLAREHNLQIICGLDTHYISKEANIERSMLLEDKKITYADEEGWYMDYPDADEIIRRFKEQGVLSEEEIYRAIMNTNVFVNECEETVLDKSFKIPNLYPEKNYEERVEIYKNLIMDAYEKEPIKSQERLDGINAEMNEVITSNVVDYFIYNHELIEKAKEYGGVLTTTSRGSMGSFYTNKLLGSTTLDRFSAGIPIFYPRFLTADRILAGQMPDEDLNCATQEPFVKAAKELIGEHGCYPLMAIEKLKAKSAWKMYARLHDVEVATANEISNAIVKYEKAKADTEEDEEIDITDYIPKKYADLYQESIEYQGIISNFKVHACGFLMFTGDIREEIGLMSAICETTQKRTLCACVQGSYLDAYGYVKDDLLIVDTVSLTAELFDSIGRDVPTFTELREMILDDKPTWEIYKRGITCCVNQCERNGTRQNVMKYAPTKIEELSSFVAAIRPGFKSLLKTFLEREPYTTGEPVIDELIEDTSHFMLYQESIMKILSFLGLKMSDTYGVIKAISKKKLKGEKKDHLEKQLKDSWLQKIGNLNNFDKVWQVINDAALYAFNSPHALSTAGDSAYCAWFKAHYPSNFYEIAITHYQNKNNKNKITALLSEAMTYFKYKQKPMKFRDDNRTISINDSTKEINMCMSSIKGVSKNAPHILYEHRNGHYDNFIELLKDIPLKKSDYEILIKLNFFSEFGTSAKLLQILSLFGEFYSKKEGVYVSKKQIKKTDLKGFTIEQLNKYADKETPSAYVFSDMTPLIQSRINDIPDSEIPVQKRLEAQFEFLGYIQPSGNKEDYKRGYVLQAYPINRKKDNTFCGFNLTIQFLATGNVTNFTYWTKDKKAIAKKDVIEVLAYSTDEYKNQKKFILKTFKKI